MYRLRMESCLLLGAALLAGCSDRSTPTAPSVRPLAATTALVDRPYTWSFTCQSSKTSISVLSANWSWLDPNGVTIDGTSQSVVCLLDKGKQTLSGSGVRPANAYGFTSCIGIRCQGWTFDPSQSFDAQHTESFHVGEPSYDPPFHSYKVNISATFTVSS